MGAGHAAENQGTDKVMTLRHITALLLAPLTTWPADTNPSALRALIADLWASYPDNFTRANEFLSRLEQAESRKSPDEMLALQREIAMANPLWSQSGPWRQLGRPPRRRRRVGAARLRTVAKSVQRRLSCYYRADASNTS